MRRCTLCGRVVDGPEATCPTCGGTLVDHEAPAAWAPPPGPLPPWTVHPGAAPPVALPVDPLAVTSLVLSLLGPLGVVVFPPTLLLSPVAAVVGHVALRRIGTQRRTSGRGLALAGVVIGWIATAVGVAIAAFVVWFVWAWLNSEPR